MSSAVENIYVPGGVLVVHGAKSYQKKNDVTCKNMDDGSFKQYLDGYASKNTGLCLFPLIPTAGI